MKLSIIVPVYNMEAYLPACLDSVLSRDLAGQAEVIAVNDGSTDRSGEILNEYEKTWPELLRVVTKENGGLGSARNAGMAVAEGEYLVFLDSDDYLAPGAVPEMLELLKDADFDLCFFDQVFYNEHGREVMRYPGAGTEGPFAFDTYPQILFYTPNAGNKLFRRSLFERTGISFPPRQWFEDVNSIYMLYPHAKLMIYRSRPWNCHLQREGSITHSGNAARNAEMIPAVRELVDHYRTLGKTGPELEYCVFYNGLLTSVDRVNLIDPESEVQNRLYQTFVELFPDYRSNPYIRTMPMKHKLLLKLIEQRAYRLLHLVLTLNEKKHQ